MGLYTSLGYKRTALEPGWVSHWQGRGGERCHLMLKRLPASSASLESQQQGVASFFREQQQRAREL
jgi:hypothetical protein